MATPSIKGSNVRVKIREGIPDILQLVGLRGLQESTSWPEATESDGCITVRYRDVSVVTAKEVLAQTAQAHADVIQALAADFGQPAKECDITIVIHENLRWPEALVPLRRIYIPARFLTAQGALTGPSALYGRGPTLWHNVTTILYPPGLKAQPMGLDRFAADGLGGYLQAELASNAVTTWPTAAYPTMGMSPHSALVRFVLQYGLHSLAGSCSWILPMDHSPDRRLAWLEAASFAKFMMENDRATYVQWYKGNSKLSTTMDQMRQAWIAFLDDYCRVNFGYTLYGELP
jgi:hypothetical protein